MRKENYFYALLFLISVVVFNIANAMDNELDQGSIKVTVSLPIYSGRPDPTWELFLNEHNIDLIFKYSSTERLSGKFGNYRGFSFLFSNSNEYRYIKAGSKPNIEKNILGTAEGKISSDVFSLVMIKISGFDSLEKHSIEAEASDTVEELQKITKPQNEETESGFALLLAEKISQSVKAVDLSEILREEFYFLYQEYKCCIDLIEEIASSEPGQGADLVNIFRTTWKKQPPNIEFESVSHLLQQIESSANIVLSSRDPRDKRRLKEFDSTKIKLSPFVQFKSMSNQNNIKSTLFYLELQNRIRSDGEIQYEDILAHFKASDTPIQCFKVNRFIEISPSLEGIFEEFRVGYAVQDENCFFHAVFTTQGMPVQSITELSSQLRQSIYDELISNITYQDYIRLELEASSIEEKSAEHQISQIKEIALSNILSFAERYIDRYNPSSIDVPISNYGVTAIIASQCELKINYYKYNTETHILDYYRTIGEGHKIINLLHNNNSYYPLFNLVEEEKIAGLTQAFVNYFEERRNILSSLPSISDSQKEMSLLGIGTPSKTLVKGKSDKV